MVVLAVGVTLAVSPHGQIPPPVPTTQVSAPEVARARCMAPVPARCLCERRCRHRHWDLLLYTVEYAIDRVDWQLLKTI